MVKDKRVKTVFILVLIVSTFVFGQEKQEKQDKQWREEILAAYQSDGEQGLRDFVKKQKDKISNKFIVDFSVAGAKERKEEWLKICLIIAKEKKDEKALSEVLYNTGEYYRVISDNKKALDYYDKALPIYTKFNALIGQGNVYMLKGRIYFTAGENLEALEMFDKALPIFEKKGDSIGLANVCFSKGVIYSRIGKNSRAFEMFDKALPIFEKKGDSGGLGNVYLGKGRVYSSLGDNSKALEMINKALPFYEKAGDPIGQGNAYFSKGDIYYIIGNKSKSLEMIDKALPFFEEAGQPTGQGNVYFGKGIIYLHSDEYKRALEMFDKALPFYEKAGQLSGQGNIYQRKGELYFRVGEHTRALKMLEKALPFFEKAGEPRGQGSVYYGKGVIYSHRRKKSRTLKMLDKALLLYQKAGDVGWTSSVLHSKALYLGQLGKKEEALELFEKGIAYRETARTKTAFPVMKRTFMENSCQQYEETTVFMLDNKYKKNGFTYAEAMRARVFLDQMAEGLVQLDKGLTPDLKEKRDMLVAKLSLLSKEMHQTAGKKEEKKIQELKEQYRKAESEFEDLLIKIRLNNPLYTSVRYPKPISVQTLQTKVLKEGELLLRYFVSPYNLYVFIISKKRFKIVTIKIKEKEIKRIVNRYLLAVEENTLREIRKYGNILYQKLFKPLEKTIKKSMDIVIVPDGALAKIPFESLILDDAAYLMEKFRIKYIQSASILSILRKHYTREGEAKSFIGFGDPVYDYENFRQGKLEQGAITRSSKENDEIREITRSCYARAGGIMNRLKDTGQELKAIARLFKKASQKSVVYLREQATEEKATAPEMKNFDFIHFACHGLLNDDFQSLVLSQLPSDKSSEDGYFTLNEIMNCDYNAKLVVLSACQTGSGKMYKGEGVTGLTQAVMYAGTPAVLASLWDVDDNATKEIMVTFYTNMLEKNMDKVEALRQAKMDLMRSKKYASPLYWSAFVMYGE